VRQVARDADGTASERARAASIFGIDPARRIVVVMGGSLGSRVINDAIERFVQKHSARTDLAVLHLVGERYMSESSPSSAGAGLHYVRRARHDVMADVWQIAEVVVCRAGASTIAELVTVGCAALIIPWAQAADDHQRLNAHWLGSNEAALVLEETDLELQFDRRLLAVIDDDAQRERLRAASRALGELNRSAAIGSLIESVAQ